MQTARLFICHEISDRIKKEFSALRRELSQQSRGVRWVKEDAVHITLKFLGDTEMSRIPVIEQALLFAASAIEIFSVSVQNTGAFPNFKRPRVFWIGLNDKTGNAVQVQENIEQELETVGVPRSDKPFHPHLTLGRVKNPKEAIPVTTRLENLVVDWGEQTIDTVTLMKSDLTPTGPLYTPLRRIALSSTG